MAVPQDWMPPDMPDAQKDEIAARHPNDPEAAAAEAWIIWANEMPVDQAITVTTGAQSVTYDQTAYDASMERARWYLSRSKDAAAVHVGGDYAYGYVAAPDADGGGGDPPLSNGEPWGAVTVTTSDVVLTNGTGPLSRSNFQTQEDANTELVQQIAAKADADHVHADDGSAVDLTDYETKADAAASHNTLDQNINTGLAGKSDKDHVHDTDLSGYVTKYEANAAHQELDQKIDQAAAGDHSHADYETKASSAAGDEALSRRITQVSTDKADTGHGHIDYETKTAAQESHQDLKDQIDDRALVSHYHPGMAPDLSSYEKKVASETRDAGLENQIKQKADAGHTHLEVQPPDLTNHVTKPELAADQALQDLALTQGLAGKSDATHLHSEYELEKDAVQRYERTELELSTKADKNHDHGATDHDHDDYATSVELQTETALRKQGDADLQSQINSAVAGGHDHDNDYAVKNHAHGNYADSSHAHPEYEGQGGSGDVTKAYVDAQDATEKQAREAGDDALQAQIDAQDLTHDHEGQYAPVHDHPYAKDEHGHSEYFLKGNAVDDDGNPLPLPYPDANSLGSAVSGKADEHGHPYVKSNADTDITPTADNRFVTLVNKRPKEDDGSYADEAFGLEVDIDEGNTWKNQFSVGNRNGFALKVLGGGGRNTWFGGTVTQKGDSLENLDDRDYIIRQNLTEATDELATKIDLEELQVEVDALATTRDAGRWTVADSAGVRPGEVHFASSSMSTSGNLITVNDTDLDGKVHGWSDLEAGDFLEVVQETDSVTFSVGSYGLFKITTDNGGTGIRSMELALDQGSGDLAAGSNVFIKVFHANNDLDLAELDQRYALKNHTHTGGSGSFISVAHGKETFFATNENWDNSVYHFAYSKSSNGGFYYGGNVQNTGKVEFKNGTNLYGKTGQSGVLIASDTGSFKQPFLVIQVFYTVQYSKTNTGGTNVQRFEGVPIYSRSTVDWTNVSKPLTWHWRGDSR